MPKTLALLIALATLALPSYSQTQAAPIVRSAAPAVTTTQPVAGVWLETEAATSYKIVSADPAKTEIRVERGRANIEVHHPADNSEILIDLPGGQTTLLKDGLYTFNAETNTVRVLHGEAEVYPGTANSTAKPIKVKEEHELSFAATNGLKAREVDPRQMMADVLPTAARPGAEGYGGGYGYGPYGDGYPYWRPYPYAFYGYYPAYGWGDPYFWGYPYGFGLGFGYYGGFGGFGGRFGRR